MVGVAVNVTKVPWQTGLAEAAMDTETGKFVLTVMVIALDVAGLPVAQVAFEDSTQVIISLFAGTYEYVVLFVPTFDPLTFH